MNKHFCEIGPKLASQITEGKSFKDYLGQSADHNFFIKAVDESDVLEKF